jgi:cell division protein FtsB
VSVAAGAGDRTRTRARLTPGAGILAIVVMALLLYLLVPLRTYLAQRSQLRRLDHQMQVLQQQNAKLQHQVARLHDPNYLERVARECLGMVKPGEIGFVLVPKRGQAQPPDC